MSARSEVIIFPQNKKIIIIFVYEITFAKLFWYSLNIIQWQFPCSHLARTFFTWQCTAFWSSWYSWVNNMSHFHLGWEKVADEKKSDVKPWLKLLPVKMGTSCILNICSLQFSRLPRVVQEKLLVWRFQIQCLLGECGGKGWSVWKPFVHCRSTRKLGCHARNGVEVIWCFGHTHMNNLVNWLTPIVHKKV